MKQQVKRKKGVNETKRREETLGKEIKKRIKRMGKRKN